MNLKEYQGKRLLKEFGISVPEGEVVFNIEDASNILKKIGGEVVVKAQILAGQRGKVGGIKFADEGNVLEIVSSVLGKKINGHEVREVLIEKKLEISKEMYLSFTIDRANKRITLVFCEEGGMDIEEIAVKFPDKILRIAGVFKPSDLPKGVFEIAQKLYKLVLEKDAVLAEINPLVSTDEGKLVAVDAKVVIDDNALFRQEEFLVQEAFDSEIEKKASSYGLVYVELDGNIAIIGNGAGLTMASLDIVAYFGGKPANFLDVGGGASVETMGRALEIAMVKKGLKSIFINIFGGITRCDEIAKGISEYRKRHEIEIPMVVRIIGTNEEEGRRILEEGGVKSLESMEEGAREVVKISSNGNG